MQSMSWITVIWSISAAFSLTLSAIHIVVWLQNRKTWANLLFSCTAFSVAVFAVFEIAMMRSQTVAQFALMQRWVHVPLFFTIVSLIGFIIFYFHSARLWLAWTVIGLRLLVLIINFVTEPSFNFPAIAGLQKFRLLGEMVSVPLTIPSPWARLGEGSAFLGFIFVLDAAARLWRRGNPDERRRAVVIGGSVAASVFCATLNGLLIHTGLYHMPYFVSLLFTLFVAAMAFELTRDLVRGIRIAEELREKEESMALAARAAQLALWRWDIEPDVIWANADGRQFLGIPDAERLSFRRFLESIHPEDQDKVREEVRRSMVGDSDCRVEYRVLRSDGALHWIMLRGQIEFDNSGQPLRMRGVTIDTTERRTIELQLAQQSMELAHLTRVNTLSELTGSLAHELNQPLCIILNNAQAAQELIARDAGSSAEFSEILSDIVAADRHACEVIHQVRTLLKRGDAVLLPLDLNQVIEEVLRILHTDFTVRGVTVVREMTPNLAPVTGDRVQLQQVVLNLILNAADAMSMNAPGARCIYLTVLRRNGVVRASVRDVGSGLPVDVECVFKPFFTTKRQGLGMGLAICRSIITAHQSRLWAEPYPDRGAAFHFELPAAGSPDLA